MVRTTKLFWKETKHVLWYLRGTTQFGLWYKEIKRMKLCGFTDSNWVGSRSNSNNTSSGIFSVGYATISWYNKKQIFVPLSSQETEYMAVIQASLEPI